MRSAQISATLRQEREEELAKIREETAKLSGEQFSNQGDTVRVKRR